MDLGILCRATYSSYFGSMQKQLTRKNREREREREREQETKATVQLELQLWQAWD